MKFVELKKSLMQSVGNGYYIFGEDKYLRDNALKNILLSLNISNPDFNICKFQEELDVEKISLSLKTLPFMSDKKVIVLIENDQTKNAKLLDVIKEHSKEDTGVVLICLANEENNIFKGAEKYLIPVDCNRLDSQMLLKWVMAELNKHQKTMTNKVICELVRRCNSYLIKIDAELNKLICYVGERKEITEEDLDLFVEQELEYKIFELTDCLSKGNKEKAFLIAQDLIEDKKTINKVIYLLSSYFNRLFQISLSDLTDSQLAEELKIKEAAVRINRKIALSYTKRGLKNIVNNIVQTDFDIKSGKSEIKSALYTLIVKIIESR